MALSKEIELSNGIKLSYHRIVTINKITNIQEIIEIASYINKEQREKEKECIEQKKPMDIFINTEYINKEYNAEETINDVYNYLKTLDKYEGAEDI